MRLLTMICVTLGLAWIGNLPAAPGLKDRPPIRAGLWSVKYHPNQATRNYVVSENGEVSFSDGEVKTKPVIDKNGDILIDFKDGKLERWTVGKDGRLFVEHFNPKENYPELPDQIGIGIRKDMNK